MKVFNFNDGSITERELELSQDVFNKVVNNDILAFVVRWQMAKKRLGCVATRSIEKIDATTKKPYRQKGTGRARQGSLVGPHYRGGAKAHGPNMRQYTFDVNKKVRSLALKMTLSHKIKNDAIFMVEGINNCVLKTSTFLKKMNAFYENLSMEKDKSCLFVCEREESFNAVKATSNLKKLNFIPVCGLNTLDLLRHDFVLFSDEALNLLHKRFGQ